MLRPCPLCLSKTPRTIGCIGAERIVSGNGTYRRDALKILGVAPGAQFEVASCSHCGFVYALESLDEGFLARLYEHVIDRDAASEIAHSTSWVAHQLQVAAALLQRVAAPGGIRFLDYGCGEGTVVRAVSGPNVRAIGFDPYASPRNATCSLQEVESIAPFDAVLLSDVLEHVPEPRLLLARCHELLAADGWLAISVPDFGSRRLGAILADLRRGLPVMPEMNPWEHLNYFSPESLAQMIEGEGFDVDFMPEANFGLRNDVRGIRRAGNAVRSAARLLRFALAPRQRTTTVFARRRV